MAGRSFTRVYNGEGNRIKAEHVNELQVALEEDDARIDDKPDLSEVQGVVQTELSNNATVVAAAESAAAAAVDANPTIVSLTPAAEGHVITSDGTSLVSSPNAVTPGEEIFIATPHTPAHLRRRADYAFDTSTTNHLVLQQAMDDIEASGVPRVLRIDGGRARISDTVQWYHRTSILGGYGNGTSAANHTAIVWAGAAGGTMFDTDDFGAGSYIHHMWVRGIQFVGYNTDPNVRAATAIRFRSYLDQQSDMREFQVVGFSGDALRYDRGGHNLVFADFRVDDVLGYGIAVTPSNDVDTVLAFRDFTVDNQTDAAATGGGFFHLNLAGTNYVNFEARATFENAKLETNKTITSGQAMVKVTPNPASSMPVQALLSFNAIFNPVRPNETGTTLLVSPATDMIAVSVANNCRMSIEGVPALKRSLVPILHNRPFLAAAPMAHDLMVPGGAQNRRTLNELVGNTHFIGNLWQHRRRAVSIILNTLTASDWDFPTRLRAGMLFMNPALNLSPRMELAKVTNDEATAGSVTGITATGTSGSNTVTVNTVGDLQIGHYITIAGVSGWFPITHIDAATNALTLGSTLSATVNGAAVGLRAPQSTAYQIPHKATAAPASGTWEQGDVVWNRSPAAGGKAGWICITAGTPGTWKAFGAIDA